MKVYTTIRTILKYISRTVLVAAVFISVINFFLYFNSDTHKKRESALEKQILKWDTEMYSRFDSTNLNKSEKQLMTMNKNILCNIMGYFCTDDPRDINAHFQKSSFAKVSQLFAYPLTSPPASGVYYVYNTFENSGFIPSAYAAEGVGFAGLKPLLEIWKKFRNLAYLILVIVIIAIGFMIMFRMKLNPQTVISVESALPKIIITMILIAFSFPIAGFLIDFMYILIAIMINTVGNIANLPQIDPEKLAGKYYLAGPSDIPGLLSGVNGWGLFSIKDLFWDIPNALSGIFGLFFNSIFRIIAAMVLFYLVGVKVAGFSKQLFGDIGDTNLCGEGSIVIAGVQICLDGLIKALVGSAAGMAIAAALLMIFVLFGLNLILFLGLIISLVYLSFRIFFMLLSTYIKILVLVLLAPLIIMFEAIPGKSSFSKWLKNLFVEIMTFPIIIGIFLLGLLILETTFAGELLRFPFLFGVDSGALGTLLGFTLLFMTPDLVKIMKKLINPDGLPLPAFGPGALFSGVSGGLGSGVQKLGSYGSTAYYMKGLKSIGPFKKFFKD